MRIVIVDTNILFISLRAKGGKMREILSRSDHKFYAPNFLIAEIFKHKDKLIQSSSASADEINEFLTKSLHNIHFVNEGLIGIGNFVEAYRLCGDVDEKDTPFVALTLEMEGELWTRDKKLVEGLTRKGFTAFFEEAGGQ
jgi:predicted nucleic acid-binding protein